MVNWTKEANIYHIYPIGAFGAPRYNDGILEHRILKCIDWIPHMKSMGINCVYFGPLWQSGSHGYDTNDYYNLDCRLGSNEDFKKVCKALHDAGIRVVLDGVFNHIGRGHKAFLDIQANRENSPYRFWIENLGFDGNNYHNDGFYYNNWGGSEDLVKLNLYNPETKDHIFNAVRMWMDEFEIDGLRLDAADCIQRDFFKELKYITKSKNPEFWLMGEIIHGDYNIYANDEMMDSVTNYECWKGIYSSHNDKNYFEINYAMKRQWGQGGIYQGKLLYNFLDNHDVNRIGSLLTDKRNLLNCYTLLYAMPGIPSIYYGSEWGLEAVKASGEETDWPLRPEITIDDIKRLDSEKAEMIEKIASLADVRSKHKALQLGNYDEIIVRNEQLIFGRSYEEDFVVCALNCTENEVDYSFNYRDKNFEIHLGPFESKILEK